MVTSTLAAHPSHIQSVELKNIRGYNCTIPMGQTNLAFGPNEAGKTSLLNAISAALYGMICTEFNGWTKDKGTMVESLVADQSKPASVVLRHQDGTTSKWAAKPKDDGGMSTSHSASSCVVPRGKEDLIRKILGATAPTARPGARKRFLEVFDLGVELPVLLAGLPADLHPLVTKTAKDLALRPTELVDGLMAEFAAQIKNINASAADAPKGPSRTEEDLNDVEEKIREAENRQRVLDRLIAEGIRYQAAQEMGGLSKTQADLAEAEEQVAIHKDDLDEARRRRDAELAALGFSDFDTTCLDAAKAHLHHIDGTCHVCGAEADKSDFEAIIAALTERANKVATVRTHLGQECITIAADLERWQATANRLKGEATALLRAGAVLPPEIPLADAQKERADLADDIVNLRTEAREIRASIDSKQLLLDVIEKKGPMERAITELKKFRDSRFSDLVDGFCAKITQALPEGWSFTIETDNDNFCPVLDSGNGYRTVDPSGAQGAILVTAMRTVGGSDPIDIAGERDYSLGHLTINLMGMTEAKDVQFFVQSTAKPDPIEGVNYIDVAKLRNRGV